MRFGRPLDPFGNDVTDDGESIDRAGRIVDPASYVRGADGEVTDDDQRDAEYTRALGRRLAAGVSRSSRCSTRRTCSRARSTTRFAKRAGTRDIYRLLRAPPAAARASTRRPRSTSVERLRARLAEHPSGAPSIRTTPSRRRPTSSTTRVRGLSTYHTRPIVERAGDMLHVRDMKLLYYYQNRTAHIPAEAAS